LVNAIKFTKEGMISVSAQENIESIMNSNMLEVIVTVKDTGTGIDPEIAPNLFSKFTTSEQGTGLGLFISKNIIEADGGKIRAENNPDGERGTTFTFSLALVTSIKDI
jgi:two-component system, OmpR family, sensor histidine kinase VicK